MERFILKNKKIIPFLIVIILFIVLICFVFDFNKRSIIDSHKENLQILAEEKASQLNIFLQSQKQILLILSSIDIFKELSLDKDNLVLRNEAKKRINELRSIVPGVTILGKDGIVIIGDIDMPGTDYSNHPYFVGKKRTNDIVFKRYYDPLRKKDYYAVIGPIYDNSYSKNIIGIISFDLELDKIGLLMKEDVKDNKGEVYLIDKKRMLLSGSSYLKKDSNNGVLIQEVKSDGANECLIDLSKYKRGEIVEEHEEYVLEYLNYMGDLVIGAHAYAPSIEGCIIAEDNIGDIVDISFIKYIKNIFSKEKEFNDKD